MGGAFEISDIELSSIIKEHDVGSPLNSMVVIILKIHFALLEYVIIFLIEFIYNLRRFLGGEF